MRRLMMLFPVVALACGEKDVQDTGEVVEAVDADGDGVTEDLDCDDADADNFPGNTEACDEADNDCDGVVDNGVLDTFYGDQDGDGFGAPDQVTEACSQPAEHVDNDGDCDDDDAAIHPDAVEVCDGADNDCDSAVDDEDDDVDAATATRWFLDSDSDDYGDFDAFVLTCEVPEGYVADSTDCNDGDFDVNPGVDELCDGQDTDCDGDVDEDDASDASTWYSDSDGDGYGDPDTTTVTCVLPDGYVDDATDCDPADSAQHPGADEYCNSEDDDCDDDIDEDDAVDALTWYDDTDNDGYGDPATTTEACYEPSGYTSDATDCDPSQSSVYPGATETVADGTDQDCDGVDTCYADGDGDGYGDPNVTQDDDDLDCSNESSGESDNDDDCDDGDGDVNPDATEVCDGVDNDCDSSTSEDGTAAFADANGVTDFTSAVTGTSSSPVSLTLADDGDLMFCAGTFYVNLDLTANDIGIYGTTGDPIDVILDGGATDRVITIETSGVTAYIADLSLTNGYQAVNKSTRGGGLVCAASSTFELDNLYIYENVAYQGAGLSSSGCDVTITNSEIYDNDGSYEAGAAIWTGPSVIEDSLFYGNVATANIGGLLLGSGTHSLDEVLVTENESSGYGGVYTYSSAGITWSGSSTTSSGITANTNSHGGLAVQGGTFTGNTIDFGTSSGGDENSNAGVYTSSGNTYDPGDDVSIVCTTSGCTY